MARFRFSSTVHVAFLAAGLVAVSSCTDDPPPGVPSSSVGMVEGYVIEAGQPVAAWVRFNSQNSDVLRVEVVTTADSTGWYHVELPLGVYRIQPTATEGESAAADVDTVTVGRAPRRKDLVRGRAGVEIGLPTAFEGRLAWLRLSGQSHQYSFHTYVADSTANFDLRMMPLGAYGMALDMPTVSGDVILINESGGVAVDSLQVSAEAPTHGAADFRSTYASIAGRVTSSPWFRGDNVYVDLVDSQGHSLDSAECDADGSFRCDFLVPVTVRLRVQNSGLERWFGGDDFSSATVYAMEPGQHLTGVELSGGGLSVRFEGPGDIVNNTAVLALRAAGGSEYFTTYPSRNPTFIEMLAEGPYTLYVYGACAGQPWQPQWYDGATDLLDATTVEIVEGQMHEITMTLAAGGLITGTFVSHTGNMPWSIRVALCDTLGHQLCPQTVPVDRTQMRLPGLRDGDYHLAMYLSSSPWWYPGTWLPSEATTISIRDGGTVSGLVWDLPFPYKKAAP